MKTPAGAQFEISVDGKPRSYRDTKATAMEGAGWPGVMGISNM